MKDFFIREATSNDIPAMCTIFKNDLGYTDCTLEIVQQKFAGLVKGHEAVFVAESECQEEKGRIVGVIHVEKYDVLYYPTMANILGLAVASDFRRKGIGGALLNHAEQWAQENGITLMRLNSGGTRKEAHEFYRAQGYDDEKMQLRFMKTL